MTKDNQIYFDILSTPGHFIGTVIFGENQRLFRKLPYKKSLEIFFTWLVSVEERAPVDFKTLDSAAWICSDIHKLDEEIMAWIKLKPTELRYAIGSVFIMVRWRRVRLVPDLCLKFLINAIENDLDKKTDGYRYALSVLYSAADPLGFEGVIEEMKRELSELLLHHLAYLKEHQLHPDLVKLLENLKDFEIRKYYSIFERAKKMDMTAFQGKTPSEIIGALLKWFGLGTYDIEKMRYAGEYMACFRGLKIEQAVCEWLKENPIRGRFNVAHEFFIGYWSATKTTCPECIEILEGIKAQFPPDSPAHRGAKYLLTVVAEVDKHGGYFVQ